jgi:hypothetical protein
MKVAKNKVLQLKLINKNFVKKTRYIINLTTYLKLFLVLALYM